jgi:Right handed beta helix region
MRKLLGPFLAAALAATALFALSADQALANHVQCGDTITQDTTLDSDLIDCPGDGLLIGADNVTLDLNGHTIDGADTLGSRGVTSEGFSGITLENGVIREFSSWAASLLGDAVTVRRVHFIDGYLEVTNATIEENVFEGSDSGLQVTFGNGSRIDRNTVVGGYIDAFEGRGTRITRNTIVGGGIVVGNDDQIERNTLRGGGIVVPGDAEGGQPGGSRIAYNKITGGIAPYGGGIFLRLTGRNVVVGNELVGGRILIVGASQNLVLANTISHLGSLGAAISVSGTGVDSHDEYWSADYNRLIRNRITDTAGGGIAVELSAKGTVIARNFLSGNGGDGIFVAGATEQTGRRGDEIFVFGPTETTIEGNRSIRNGDDGIDVEDPAPLPATTSISDNRAWFNGDLGIEAVAGVTGSGNSAKHNGNPAECVPDYLCRASGRP